MSDTERQSVHESVDTIISPSRCL